MSGTKEGSAKATAKILARNPNFFKEIGRKGGLKPTTGGFYQDRDRAKLAGQKGGKKSKVGYTYIDENDTVMIYRHIKTNVIFIFNKTKGNL